MAPLQMGLIYLVYLFFMPIGLVPDTSGFLRKEVITIDPIEIIENKDWLRNWNCLLTVSDRV